MRIAFFSDIHGNLPALEAALADAKARGANHLICLGDIVGYGPQPIECLQRIRQIATATVMGNHDAAVCGLFDREYFNAFARETAERAILVLSDDDLAWLKTLPYQIEGNGFFCTHGSFNEPEAFDYLSECEDAALSFSLYPNQQLFFVGHTHMACVFAQDETEPLPRKLPPEDFTVQEGVRYIINPGTIGFPRGDSLTADYVLFDTVTQRVSFHCVEYDLAPYRLALVKNGYNLLNYWFLSPKASRRRTELSMRAIPTRRVLFDEKSGFSLQRPTLSKWLLPFFYCVTGLLLFFMVVVSYLVIKSNAKTPLSPTVAKTSLVEAPPPPLPTPWWGTLDDWNFFPKNAFTFSIQGDALVFEPVKPNVPFIVESSRIPLTHFGALSDAYQIAYLPTCAGDVDYQIRCVYYRDDGSAVKGSLHKYKTDTPVQFIDKDKSEFTSIVISIHGTLHETLTFQHFSIQPKPSSPER